MMGSLAPYWLLRVVCFVLFFTSFFITSQYFFPFVYYYHLTITICVLLFKSYFVSSYLLSSSFIQALLVKTKPRSLIHAALNQRLKWRTDEPQDWGSNGEYDVCQNGPRLLRYKVYWRTISPVTQYGCGHFGLVYAYLG